MEPINSSFLSQILVYLVLLSTTILLRLLLSLPTPSRSLLSLNRDSQGCLAAPQEFHSAGSGRTIISQAFGLRTDRPQQTACLQCHSTRSGSKARASSRTPQQSGVSYVCNVTILDRERKSLVSVSPPHVLEASILLPESCKKECPFLKSKFLCSNPHV